MSIAWADKQKPDFGRVPFISNFINLCQFGKIKLNLSVGLFFLDLG